MWEQGQQKHRRVKFSLSGSVPKNSSSPPSHHRQQQQQQQRLTLLVAPLAGEIRLAHDRLPQRLHHSLQLLVSLPHPAGLLLPFLQLQRQRTHLVLLMQQGKNRSTPLFTGGHSNQDPPYTQKPIYYTFFCFIILGPYYYGPP